MSMPAFASRLSAAIQTSNTVLCVGLDPHPDLMPNAFGGPNQAPGTTEALSHLRNFCLCIIAAAKDRVPAIKPQAALFEAHGAGGMAVLAEIAERAREAGLLVIMDAKRGDIGSTARAYAAAWLGSKAAFASDALTINPYLGMDSLEPFFAQAAAAKSGLFILTRTSNKGSADIQQQNLAEGDGAKIPVYKHLAHLLSPYIERAIDTETGLSNIGIVAGATGPSEAQELRKLLPSALFLIPGYGAQGASAADACSGLIQKTDGRLTGGLVNASRAITHNVGVQEASSPEAAKQAMIEAINIAKQELEILPSKN
ncbi:MAG: orotidine-5'-phosphate decarboxylase [Alphaproteobacteria bacterium]|nr:orotidine-5'-phosphate decarboxylase [Alphaproteobacteria bacterium]